MVEPMHSGKVRDTYKIDDDRLLMVASDRVSVFDVVLGETIPGKGKILTALTEFWLDKLAWANPHHMVTTDLSGLPSELRALGDIEGRAMIVKRCDMLPIEFIVRGHLYGSVVNEYREKGSVCGIELPQGLTPSTGLTEPIVTPSTKAPDGEHDVNITHEEAREIMREQGFNPDLFDQVAHRVIGLYREAYAIALELGLVIADTKFELGVDNDGNLTLCDEVLTPDSSRFWDGSMLKWRAKVAQFDKQVIRDFYSDNHPEWGKTAPAPPLPDDVIAVVSRNYQNLYQMFTGKRWQGS